MSLFEIIVVAILIVLFAGLSLLPAIFKDSDNDSLVQFKD